MDNCRGPDSPKQLHRLATVQREIAKAKSTYRYSDRLCTAFNTGFQPNLGVMMTFFDLKIVGKIFKTWPSPPISCHLAMHNRQAIHLCRCCFCPPRSRQLSSNLESLLPPPWLLKSGTTATWIFSTWIFLLENFFLVYLC